MTDQLEQELRDVLVGRAGDVGHPSFGGDVMVTRGRAARRRRQGMALAGTAAAVVATLVVGGALLRPTHEALPPAYPGQFSEPLPPDFARILATLPKGEQLDRDLVIGAEIVAPDGDRSSLDLPDGLVPGAVVRAKGGWLVEANPVPDGGAPQLWIRPDDGAARRLLTDYGGTFAVSTDGGRAAVVTGMDVSLREMPSGKELSRTTYETPLGPIVHAIVGEKVALAGAQGSGGARDVGIWDLAANKVDRFPDPEIGIADLTADGRTVLVRVPSGTENCAGVGRLDSLIPREQICGRGGALDENVLLSPDGSRTAVGRGETIPDLPLSFAEIKDVRRDVFAPVPVRLPKEWAQEAVPLVWEDSRSLIVEMRVPDPPGAALRAVLLRCAVGGRCERVRMPTLTVSVNAVVR